MAERMLDDAEFPMYTLDTTSDVKYDVKLYDSVQIDPVMSLTTYGGWNVEGQFICVYEGGLKKGFLIPSGTHLIETVESKPDPLTDPIETIQLSQEEEELSDRLAEPVDTEPWTEIAEDVATKIEAEEKDGQADVSE